MADETEFKPVIWLGSSYNDLCEFPDPVQDRVGYALYVAQRGGMHRDAKALTGFGGASVVEVVANHDKEAFRAVYTVRFQDAVYVLHAFQKKSKSGSETPQRDMELIKSRLREAERMHRGGKL